MAYLPMSDEQILKAQLAGVDENALITALLDYKEKADKKGKASSSSSSAGVDFSDDDWANLTKMVNRVSNESHPTSLVKAKFQAVKRTYETGKRSKELSSQLYAHLFVSATGEAKKEVLVPIPDQVSFDIPQASATPTVNLSMTGGGSPLASATPTVNLSMTGGVPPPASPTPTENPISGVPSPASPTQTGGVPPPASPTGGVPPPAPPTGGVPPPASPTQTGGVEVRNNGNDEDEPAPCWCWVVSAGVATAGALAFSLWAVLKKK